MTTPIIPRNHFLARFSFDFSKLYSAIGQGLISRDLVTCFEGHMDRQLAVVRTGEIVRAILPVTVPMWFASIDLSSAEKVERFKRFLPRMNFMEEFPEGTTQNLHIKVLFPNMAPDTISFFGERCFMRKIKEYMDVARIEHPDKKEYALTPIR